MRAALSIFTMAVATTAALAAPENPNLGATVAETLRNYQSADITRRAAVELPMIGMLSGLAWGNSTLEVMRHERPLFCQPPSLSLTVDQVMEILATSVRENPKVASEPLGFAVIDELQKVFPCNGK